MSAVGRVAVAAVVALLVVLPFVDLWVPVLFPDVFASPGTLQILATCLILAALAVSYDVVFGYAGLLSFGHALFFGLGIYGTNLLMGAGISFVPAAGLAVVVGTTVAAVVGAVGLRLRGIAFAMVTLAFVEVLGVLLVVDPFGITGGDEGLPVASAGVPDLFRTVANTAYLYWLALAVLLVTYLVAWLVTTSSAGLVWEAVRENEDRMRMLGFQPYPTKLLAFTIGGLLASLAGSVFLLVTRGSNPASAAIEFSLALLVMVILGGAGRLWGAAIGGAVYGLLTLRLPTLSTSGLLDPLPPTLREVVAEPLLILGLTFVVVVLVLPSGLAGGLERLRSALGPASARLARRR